MPDGWTDLYELRDILKQLRHAVSIYVYAMLYEGVQ